MTIKSGLLAYAAPIALVALVGASPAAAQTVRFDVPAQSASTAVPMFAAQADLRILVSASLTEGVRTNAVSGQMTPRAALEQLLRGTSLRIGSWNGGVVTLDRTTVAAATPTSTELDEVVVTGLRASLETAREVKRRSDAIVDVVAAEDVNQLPDNSATEALARLPGVQIFRNRGEGQAITIRGISQVLTTINGQEAYTGSSRRTLLNSYPANLIKSMEVYKALTPDLIEGGIGGAVNVQLRQPLEMGPTVAGTLRSSYDDQSEKTFYNADVLFSDRWRTSLGEIGALLNLSYLRRDYLESYRETLQPQATTATQSVRAPDGTALGAGLRFPTGILVKHPEGRFERPVATAAVQWRPSYNLGLSLRATNIHDDNNYNDNDFTTAIAANTALSNVELVPGTDLIKSATFTAPLNSGPRSSNAHELLDTTQIEFGADYTAGPATISTDLVYTTSKIETDSQLFLMAFNQAPTVNAVFQSDSKYGGLSYSYADVDVTDLDNFHVRAYSDTTSRANGDGLQWRTDVDYDLGSGFFRAFKAGFRYAGRSTDYQYGTRLADLNARNLPLSAFPGGDAPLVINAGFHGDDAEVPRSWIGYDGELLAESGVLNAMNAYVAGLGYTAFASDRPAYDPLKAFNGDEATYALYGQFKYGFPIAGFDVDGIVGVRAVQTKLEIDGTQMSTTRTPTGGTVVTYDPIHGERDYTDVDPSVSAVVHFTPSLQLRLAWTKTFNRPDFSQLNPSMNLVQVTAASGAYAGVATAGNPELEPVRSQNWDASLEWYFGRAGAASFALFQRDVEGFIVNTIQQEEPAGANGTVDVTRPINAGDGTIKGIEANVSTFFDFLPDRFRNFGAYANYTYIDAEQVLPATAANTAFTGPIAGVSENSFNAGLYYDDGKLRARVAYAIRDDFTLSYNLSNRDNDLKWYPIERLDASVTYRLTPNVALTVDGTNLLAEPQRAYWGDKSVTDRVYFEGRVFSAALRFKY
ncbi:MAG: TonB-dependent receptor [Brevundimonas sp.]|uniref:TonB-dependent receptor n=1 Tax=Brevundimonas sp. TaxID=1871086 RepID=UPI002588659E|nr:TonB-dependent receptor [Brevundimonas sp.]MCV0413782.1 TonB-dependent receptor [Brevundimonas sp.]